MFEVGFMELALIFVVALVVLGPTRLPGLVRTVGKWVGKARSVARDFQQQLENEANLAELNRMTDLTTKANTTPPPPFTDQASIDAQAAVTPAPDLASSGYPYGAEPVGAEAEAPHPAPDAPPATAEPQPQGEDAPVKSA